MNTQTAESLLDFAEGVVPGCVVLRACLGSLTAIRQSAVGNPMVHRPGAHSRGAPPCDFARSLLDGDEASR